MFTWTDNIYDAVWNHLKLFAYPANVKRLLTGEIASNRQIKYDDQVTIKRKSRQIAYSISHAIEYFNAADTISINTSPLLYFYGMLSLAKALIVANNPDILLDDIKYHGLYVRPISNDLRQYVEDQSQWNIDREFAVSNEGVFKHLTDLIQGFKLPDSSIIFLKNLLSVDPELSEIYRKYYQEEPSCQYLSDHRVVEDPKKDVFIFELLVKCDDKISLEKRFPALKSSFEIGGRSGGNKKLGYRNKGSVKSFPDSLGIYGPTTGGNYLIGGLEYENNGKTFKRYIVPELCDYLSMFILSNCVRYKQEFWGQVVRGEIEGTIGIINLFISNSKRRFPNFILNSLFNESFKYGSPGYLT